MPNLPLTDEQRKVLQELSHSDSVLLMHRARLILAYADGKPTMQAAQEAGISRGRARYWKREFFTRGMGIFDSEGEQLLEHAVDDQLATGADAELIAAVDIAQEEEIRTHVIEAIPLPEVRKNMGLTPDDSLASAGKKVWLYHFAIMLSHETGTLEGKNIEELHDMRVATRRMRTAFEVFGEAFDEKAVRRHLKGLQKIARSLGRVRDMDVLYENAVEFQKSHIQPGQGDISPLLRAWEQDIEAKRQKLLKQLQGDAYHQFVSDFNQFLQTPYVGKEMSAAGIGMAAHIRDVVPVLLYNRYARVRTYDSILPTATISQLHALRIEYKKFRYTLEYFKEILGNTAGSLINEIKQYQDHLGELHDSDVACQLVRDYLSQLDESQTEVPIAERINPEPVVSYLAFLHSERYRLMSTFPEKWHKFNRPEFRQDMAKAISTL